MTMKEISKQLIDCLNSGGKLLICGNGGSATMSDHMTGELVGTFYGNEPLPAISLTNSAIITALGNDLGFEEVFSRQVLAYGKKGDILVLFSSSFQGTDMPHSQNLFRAQSVAQSLNIQTLIWPQDGKTTEDIQDNQQKQMHQVCKEVKQYFG